MVGDRRAPVGDRYYKLSKFAPASNDESYFEQRLGYNDTSLTGQMRLDHLPIDGLIKLSIDTIDDTSYASLIPGHKRLHLYYDQIVRPSADVVDAIENQTSVCWSTDLVNILGPEGDYTRQFVIQMRDTVCWPQLFGKQLPHPPLRLPQPLPAVQPSTLSKQLLNNYLVTPPTGRAPAPHYGQSNPHNSSSADLRKPEKTSHYFASTADTPPASTPGAGSKGHTTRLSPTTSSRATTRFPTNHLATSTPSKPSTACTSKSNQLFQDDDQDDDWMANVDLEAIAAPSNKPAPSNKNQSLVTIDEILDDFKTKPAYGSQSSGSSILVDNIISHSKKKSTKPDRHRNDSSLELAELHRRVHMTGLQKAAILANADEEDDHPLDKNVSFTKQQDDTPITPTQDKRKYFEITQRVEAMERDKRRRLSSSSSNHSDLPPSTSQAIREVSRPTRPGTSLPQPQTLNHSRAHTLHHEDVEYNEDDNEHIILADETPPSPDLLEKTPPPANRNLLQSTLTSTLTLTTKRDQAPADVGRLRIESFTSKDCSNTNDDGRTKTGVRRYLVNHLTHRWIYIRNRLIANPHDPMLLMRRQFGSGEQTNYYMLTTNMEMLRAAVRSDQGAVKLSIPGENFDLYFVRIINLSKISETVYKTWTANGRKFILNQPQNFFLVAHADPRIEFMMDPIDANTHLAIIRNVREQLGLPELRRHSLNLVSYAAPGTGTTSQRRQPRTNDDDDDRRRYPQLTMTLPPQNTNRR